MIRNEVRVKRIHNEIKNTFFSSVKKQIVELFFVDIINLVELEVTEILNN